MNLKYNNDYFHFNFGWKDNDDGWLTIDNLRPNSADPTTINTGWMSFVTPASWYTISPGTTRTYAARKSITLKPGFHAQAGSNFTARIEPCSNCGGTSSPAARLMIVDDISSDDRKK